MELLFVRIENTTCNWFDCQYLGDKPGSQMVSCSPASFVDHSSQIAHVVGRELSPHRRQTDAVPGGEEGRVDGVVGDAGVLAVKLHRGAAKHMVCVIKQAERGL